MNQLVWMRPKSLVNGDGLLAETGDGLGSISYPAIQEHSEYARSEAKPQV